MPPSLCQATRAGGPSALGTTALGTAAAGPPLGTGRGAVAARHTVAPWLQRCPRAGPPTSCRARCSTASGSSTSSPRRRAPATARGTLVHAVLERLFDLPAAERTHRRGRGAGARSSGQRLLEEEPELARCSPTTTGGTDAWFDGRRGAGREWFCLEDPTRLEPAERELYVETDLDGLVLRGYVDRLDVAPGGAMRVVDYKTGRSPSELFEAKALFQMKFYALVLWRLRGVDAPAAAAGLPRQQRDRRLRARRARPAGHRAQGQGAVAGDRARGHDRRLAPPARAGSATGATTGPCARPGAALPRRCPRTPRSSPSTRALQLPSTPTRTERRRSGGQRLARHFPELPELPELSRASPSFPSAPRPSHRRPSLRRGHRTDAD